MKKFIKLFYKKFFKESEKESRFLYETPTEGPDGSLDVGESPVEKAEDVVE